MAFASPATADKQRARSQATHRTLAAGAKGLKAKAQLFYFRTFGPVERRQITSQLNKA
jgi:hypothetical protein